MSEALYPSPKTISLTLPDGSRRDFAEGKTLFEVTETLGKTVSESAVAAELNGNTVDLSLTLAEDAQVNIITLHDKEALEIIRLSSALVLGQAVKELYPDVRRVEVVLNEHGYHYDFQIKTPFTTADLVRIEQRMLQLISHEAAIVTEKVKRSEAIAWFEAQNEPYKVSALDQVTDDAFVHLWHHQDYVDEFPGPHVPNTRFLKHFKLLSVAGAYWRGDASKEQLQRIHVTTWATSTQLLGWLESRAVAEQRDHRKLGRDLDLFHFQENAPGAVFWHPHGWTLFQQLIRYMRLRHDEAGYVEVNTPDVMDRTLWEISGHWDNYRDNMFTIQTEDGRSLALKPMNCPGAVALFNHGMKSYRDLPIRMSEFGKVHRYEPSGSLHGLLRVRHFTQDDAHIFCTDQQVEAECRKILSLVLNIYHQFGFQDVAIKLSTRPEKRIGSDDEWDRLEGALEASLMAENLEWSVNPGEGAFYGPKLEFVLRDAIGRDWQCGTLQVDMNLPARFEMSYVDEEGCLKRPVMLHRALFGSLERFTGILLEHYAGKLPAWLSPVQVVVITVSGQQSDYAHQVAASMRQRGIRCECDLRNEKIGLKIREATLSRVPFMLIVGAKEEADQRATVRDRNGGNMGTLLLDEAAEMLALCCQLPSKESVSH
ncbi:MULTISPECIES: threonine--tRNA ligase [Erwiniaceae]|uniref:threonine--tRNA ligase n=1 Tax=Erwiniaceae TaxID=1903409 RepID=UPI001909B511|nr:MULTISPECIES: threonine--tRNA ligase [Erwiniaceae]MBK0093605.1 threonine--tRNA ligase [Erwinia sp. S59]MBK0127326.1 threonine--tRNA ligase [Pantoea sp. S61]